MDDKTPELGSPLSQECSAQPLYNWLDVTSAFIEATDELKQGELFHDSSFGLFEAMSAIEMMDPKMDAGMVCNQKSEILNLEQGIEMGKIIIKDIALPDQIAIIDTTFACLVTWLEGHSLAQTVFTSLYTHNPDIIEDRCIKAFTLAILKMVDIIKDKVIRASVYEEEDFQPLLYGFQLAPKVTELRVCGMLKEVEEEYNKKIKNTRTRPTEKKDDVKELQHEQYMAVHTRIKATRMIYTTLLDLNKKEVKTGLEEAKKHLDQSSSLLAVVKQSINLGTSNQESDLQQVNADISSVMGFEPLVNQRLLPPTFPRYTKIVGRLEAIEYLMNLIERLKKVCQVTNQPNFQAIMDFFIDFSKECPCILSRSILQLIFLPYNNKRVFGVELLQDSIKEYLRTHVCFPVFMVRHPLYNHQQAKEHIDAFLSKAVRPICQLMQVHGHNRARQREKLAHALEELSSLQDEAEQLDRELSNMVGRSNREVSCFSNWALYYTLRTMIQHMQLGFELELYAVHEYHYIYWYLSEFLYKWLESTLRRLEVMLQEKESQIDQTQKSRISRKKAKKKKSRPIDREMVLVEAFQAMTCGYYKAMIGFKMSRKLVQPNYDFDQEKIRYEHRLSAFTIIMTPPPVQYEHFLDMTHPSKYPTAGPAYFFQMAQQAFQQARQRFESISNPTEEMTVLGIIAKTNFVVVKLLASGHMKESPNPPEFDFSSHPTYPIIRLK
ncbi:N-alpha-acetyltransferase 35, NatC auxiliary subunit-like [Anneissia japonica]|uniref:N-alpha-acetyltransferase 35, NatC auxiliary subunit-like n=1 Tax=Anneissia japonica TaxID=1529436 RepID=UPI0014254F42|nr:N-alpha-acetyltransferase 35, NatC auxiliary subunit-like [Anneissia japonica]